MYFYPSYYSYRYALHNKFAIKDFFSKSDQFRKKLRIWSHLMKKSSKKNISGVTEDANNIIMVAMNFEYSYMHEEHV